MAKKRKFNEKTKIVNAIRRIWFYSPLRREAMNRTKEGQYYRCQKCRGLHEKIQVDHKVPAVDPEKGWQGYDLFITNMFCPIDELQNLCESCHSKKTIKERAIREKAKARKEEDNE